MELRQLRYFVLLADELSFTRAAQLLHIVQPALSQQIKDLEDELGVLLFYRSKRSVNLTEAGRIFLPEARKTLEQARYAVEQTRRAEAGTIGRIMIGYSSGSVLSGVLGSILRRYRQAFPEVELNMRQVFPATQIDLLIRREIDVIFGMSNSIIVPRDCEIIPLARYPLRLVMSVEHPLAGRKKIKMKELAEEPFIAYSDPDDQHGEKFLKLILGFEPLITHRTSSLLFMGVLIEAGFGLAVLPTVMSEAFSTGVTSRLLDGAKVSFDVAAMVRKKGLDPAVKHLLDIAAGPVRDQNAAAVSIAGSNSRPHAGS